MLAMFERRLNTEFLQVPAASRSAGQSTSVVQGLSRNRRLLVGASFSQALFPILFMIGIRVQTLLFLALDSSPAWAEGGKDLVYKP